MRTWEIAKALVGNCTSPEDVDQVIRLLNDSVAIQDVCSILSSFTKSQALTSPQKLGNTKGRQTSSYAPRLESRSTIRREPTKGLDDSSEVAQAYQLEALFRASGKTNRGIEQWMSENFNVKAVIGKGSLHQYLTRVLRKADLGLRNRILSAAQNLAGKDTPGTSDIKDYWDELEKRYVVSDSNE